MTLIGKRRCVISPLIGCGAVTQARGGTESGLFTSRNGYFPVFYGGISEVFLSVY